MPRKGFLIATAIATAVLAAGGASIYAYRRNLAAKQPQPPAPAVFSGGEITLEGRIRAISVQAIAAPIEGKIDSFHAEPGDEVYEGQLLAVIRSEALETARQKAELDLESAQTRVNNLEGGLASARLEASRADADASRARAEAERMAKLYQREKMLLAEGATPRLKFEKTEREYDAARAEEEALATLAKNAGSRVEALQRDLDAARRVLNETAAELDEAKGEAASGEVRSPVNGVLIGRRGVAGDQVDPSLADFLQIATDLGRLEVVLEPAPPVLARIKPGQQAGVSVAERAGDSLPGSVKALDQGKVVVEFANPDPLIKPGLTAHVRIRF
ncbi:MAG TPA: biotin/lipoyl-binding protein [Bryobacteraceae bacterium]|nr:biotin/lipoyl-binding protein [Bryobacteraceae bacterium]